MPHRSHKDPQSLNCGSHFNKFCSPTGLQNTNSISKDHGSKLLSAQGSRHPQRVPAAEASAFIRLLLLSVYINSLPVGGFISKSKRGANLGAAGQQAKANTSEGASAHNLNVLR